MDGTNQPETGPTLEERRALRHSLNAADREEVEEAVGDLLASDREEVEEAVGDLLDILGRTSVRQILLEFALADDTLLYADLERRLDMEATELAERLQELTERRILDRTTYDGVSTKVEYEPSATVRENVPALVSLYSQAIENDA